MDQARPIIIKKKKGGGGDGHHGGAWKVAYADFVTAMMAFFLLMWLLNATSEDQRKGLADYFDPSLPISRTSAGGAGMLGGDTVFTPEQASGSRTEGERAKPTHSEEGKDLGELDASPNRPDGETLPDTIQATSEGLLGVDNVVGNSDLGDQYQTITTGDAGSGFGGTEELGAIGPGEGQLAGMTDPEGNALTEGQALRAVGEDLISQVQTSGDTRLLEHFSLRMTPEGLVVEITDLAGDPLFESGSVTPSPIMKTLVEILVPVLERTTNDIAVIGHTDASPFASKRDYSNWELSADRASAARRLMLQLGFAPARIVQVTGKAATDPLGEDPFAAQNRRIAITLLRETTGN